MPVALWAGLVLYASTSVGSGDNSAHVLRSIWQWFFPHATPASLPEVNYSMRKTAHVIQFVIYAVLLWRGLSLPPALVVRRRLLLLWVLGSAAALAFLSEGIQLFTAVRSPLFTDVLLDVSGAVIGAALMLAAGRIAPQRHTAEPAPPAQQPPGKILITSDLNLDTAPDGGREIFQQIKGQLSESRAGMLVVAGDFGPADRAAEWMAGLRAATGPDVEIVICLGNRDHWHRPETAPCSSLGEVREKFWRPACAAHRISCLDFENVNLPGLTICGGYGHYDFGFQAPGIDVDGQSPSLSDYENGAFAGLSSPDAGWMPGIGHADEAAQQARAISRRLSVAADRGFPVLFATHTAPFASLLAGTAGRSSLPRFFDAFAGNRAIGILLCALGPSIALAVCGHTHVPIPLTRIQGIPCLNIGSAPGRIRFLVFDPQNNSVRSSDPIGSAGVA